MNKKPKILMVDDEEEFLYFAKLNLEKTGKYQVCALTDPVEALRLAQVYKPDLALLDIVMPQMDGARLAEQLKQITCTEEMPVIFITALLNTKEENLNTRHEFIAKPVSTAALMERIDRMLAAVH